MSATATPSVRVVAPPRDVGPAAEPGEHAPSVPAPAPGLRLTPTVCCLCRVEDADPIAVGEDFEYRTSRDTFLAMRCRGCGLIYLNPRPADDELPRIYPDDYHAFVFKPEEYGLVYRVRRRLEARRVLSWCRGLPADARILDVGCGDGFHLRLLKEYGQAGWRLEGVDTDRRAVEAARNSGLKVHEGQLEQLRLPDGAYDLVLLVMTIEHAGDPGGLLASIRHVLRPGGRVVIVTDNAASLDAWLFRGRHWGGYHFPRHWTLFNSATLRRLAEQAGLEAAGVTTCMTPVNWVYSFHNLLADWGAPRWLVNRFTLKSTLSLAAFTLVDLLLTAIGRGGILRGIFRKPADNACDAPGGRR
jgi:SAM-dependent methyltransferase